MTDLGVCTKIMKKRMFTCYLKECTIVGQRDSIEGKALHVADPGYNF